MTNPQGARRVRFGHPPSGPAGPPPFGVGGALVGMLVVAVVFGGLAWSAWSGRPPAAQRPSLFAGSLVLEDTRPLTVINVATAQITVRLDGVNSEVGAANDADVEPVPVSGGTMLVNRESGSFNFLEADDYVTDPNEPGVGLGRLDGASGAEGLGAGADAYIVRAAPAGTVSLVGRQTVEAAARAQAATVTPLGFAGLGGPVGLQPGSAAVSGEDLWVLVGRGPGCQAVQLHPSGTSRQGLAALPRLGFQDPCRRGALESAASGVGLATPGRVQLFPSGSDRPVSVPTPVSAGAARILPVTGASGRLWFLSEVAGGWVLFGVDRPGRMIGPFPLAGLGPFADPVVPVLSGGFLYTVDQNQPGQPTLWTIDPANGHMAPLRGTPQYPLLSPSEKDSFHGTEVVLDGPRVVFNNPQSLEAVVVFTDGDRYPVVVDKSRAVAVSTTGPADLAARSVPAKPAANGRSGAAPDQQRSPLPVVQPVSQQITCANTTQKPYAPQITGVSASSGSALIQWSYQLLDQTDCEPSSWAVQVKALAGTHQPARPVRVVIGEDRYLFTGLRPTTSYQVTVTAYINRQSTPSAPTTFATAARGPDAPLWVRTRSDGNGDWSVSWAPCTEAVNPNCVVPADRWTVTAAGCAGSFVGSPPAVEVPGGRNSVTINAASLQMLGDSMSFSVQGSLASGLTGNPTSDGSCTEAYQKPDAAAITLSGQGREDPSTNTITATLTVLSNGDPNTVFGVRTGAQFLYTVATPAGTQTVGPVAARTATITGLPPGVALTPTVRIYPAGHPEAAVTVTGAPFKETLGWPDLGATRAVGKVDADPNQGSVTVTFPPGVPSGPLTAIAPVGADPAATGPQVQCGGPGGAVLGYPPQAVGGSRRITFPMEDLVSSGGSCTVSLSLADGADPDPYGGPSPLIAAAFTIGTQPSYAFTYRFVGCAAFQCGPLGKPYTVEVDSASPFKFGGGGDWTVTAHDPSIDQPQLDPCYISQRQPTPPKFPLDIQLPQDCLHTGSIAVTVRWEYLGQSGAGDAKPANSPRPPATTTTTSTTTSTTSTTNPSATRTPGPVAAQTLGWSFAVLALVGLAGGGQARHRTKKGSR